MAQDWITKLFGKKVNNIRITPLSVKIILVFTVIILVSNFSSNYINLIFNRVEQTRLLRELLIKDLKEMYTFTNNQHEIYQFDGDMPSSIDTIEKKAVAEFKNEKAIFLGVKKDGELLFEGSKQEKKQVFSDKKTLDFINKGLSEDTQEAAIYFTYNGNDYFGIYKYNEKWDAFLIRAEEVREFNRRTNLIFATVAGIIILLTLISAGVGVWILRHLMRYIGVITNSIIEMTQKQELETIPLQNASLDDITFLGMSFNSLSATINNLLFIFRKFVNKDIALQAYKEKSIRLEGKQRELTMLFSDIKGFTMITETLGTDIIRLINIHYDKAIREIIDQNGVIGSIIGDALLAVFGTIEVHKNKSYDAVMAAYKIQEVAASLRLEMRKRKEELQRRKKRLSAAEMRVYKAVLLEVGVGIDGGQVFYGNIGSYERMTNTVIGDTVNSASRLEGLTRVYKVPVIISEYIKKEIEAKVPDHNLQFVELDKVQVKGKTIGKKVYWPIPLVQVDEKLQAELELFHQALQLYYEGNWRKAGGMFKELKLGVAEVFVERTSSRKPRDWKGMWEMKTK